MINKTIFFSSLGFLLTIFFFWFRFLRTKGFSLWLSQNKMFFIFIFSFFLCYFIILIIKAFLKISYPQKSSVVYTTLSNFICKYSFIKFLLEILLQIKDSPKTFYENIIYPNINMVYVIEKPVYFILNFFVGKPKDIIYLVFKTIPRMVFAFLFFLTVFFIKSFIFIKTSILLLSIPMFYNIYFYIVKHFCKVNLPYFIDHLKLVNTENDFLNLSLADKTPNYPDAIDLDKNRTDNVLNWFVKNFDIYSNINSFLQKLEEIENFYKPFEDIFVYSLYSIIYLYFIYVILY